MENQNKKLNFDLSFLNNDKETDIKREQLLNSSVENEIGSQIYNKISTENKIKETKVENQEVDEIWNNILELIPSIPTRLFYLNLVKFVEINNNVIKLGFKRETILNVAKSSPKLSQLETAINAVNKNLKVEFFKINNNEEKQTQIVIDTPKNENIEINDNEVIIKNVSPTIQTNKVSSHNENKHSDENDKLQVSSDDKSNSGLKHFFLGLAIILTFAVIFFVIDYKEKEAARLAEAISSQYVKTYDYLLENDPQYMISIHELSNLTKKSVEELDNDMHNQFKEEKEKNINELVDNIIEDKNDDKYKESCLKTYFRNDSAELNNEIKSKLEERKVQKIKQLVTEWQNNSINFETNKSKYLKTLFANNENELNKALDTELGYKQFTLVQKPLPRSGVIKYYTNSEPVAPFEIKTSRNDYYNDETTATNYFIKLVDYYDEDITWVTLFVRNGESVKVDVPVGDYKLKYAIGETWYGEKDLFGHKTSYSKSDQKLSFTNSGYMVYGHTITLYKVQNGHYEQNWCNFEDKYNIKELDYE